MNLLDSLLDAITRLEGDALVMHVGEKPYVVTISASMNEYRGPLAWGQVELSSRVLTADAVLGMLGQLLPLEQRQVLEEYGAVEYEIPHAQDAAQHFTIIAARGGDDVWLEMRRRPEPVAIVAEEEAPPAALVDELVVSDAASAVGEVAAEETYELHLEDTEPVAEQQEPETNEPSVAEPAPVVEQAAHLDEQDETYELRLDEVAPADLTAAVQDSEALGREPDPQEQDVFDISLEEAQPVATIDVEPAVPVAADTIELVSEVEQLAPTDDEVNALLEGATDVASSAPAAAAAEQSEEAPSAGFVAASASATDAPDAPVAREPEPLVAVAEAPVESREPAPIVEAPVAARVEREAPVESREPDSIVRAPVAAEWREPAPIVEAPFAARAEHEAPAEAREREPEPAVEQRTAVVLPISRSPVRPEIPSQPGPATLIAPLEHMLRVAAARGASTVYVVAHSKPMIRVDGEISVLDAEAAFTAADVDRIVMDLAPAPSRDRNQAVEWMSDVPEVGRVRCVTFSDHRGPGIIFRMIPPRAISADQLGLSAEVQALCGQPDGLVLVTGARASGKSTLLSAFVDLINRTRSDHVITIESQIGFVHESRKSFVSQREVRGDSEAAAAAIRSAFREDPDVLVIEDLRTPEIVMAAIEAAGSGRLVFGSLPAASTAAALERLVELLPAERRKQAQGSLASSLRGVVAQVLLRKNKGGRIAAREVLLNTPSVAGLIVEGKLFQLPVALESGRRQGMVPLNEALATLVREGTVHVGEAYRKALDREGLLTLFKRDGIDTSFAERLA